MKVNWIKIEESLRNADLLLMPHDLSANSSRWSIRQCLDWINTENKVHIDAGLFPIYGWYEGNAHKGECEFLLVEPETGLFYTIEGDYDDGDDMMGQLYPTVCPIEQIRKGKRWGAAYETVLKVIHYFKDRQD